MIKLLVATDDPDERFDEIIIVVFIEIQGRIEGMKRDDQTEISFSLLRTNQIIRFIVLSSVKNCSSI